MTWIPITCWVPVSELVGASADSVFPRTAVEERGGLSKSSPWKVKSELGASGKPLTSFVQDAFFAVWKRRQLAKAVSLKTWYEQGTSPGNLHYSCLSIAVCSWEQEQMSERSWTALRWPLLILKASFYVCGERSWLIVAQTWNVTRM